MLKTFRVLTLNEDCGFINLQLRGEALPNPLKIELKDHKLCLK